MILAIGCSWELKNGNLVAIERIGSGRLRKEQQLPAWAVTASGVWWLEVSPEDFEYFVRYRLVAGPQRPCYLPIYSSIIPVFPF